MRTFPSGPRSLMVALLLILLSWSCAPEPLNRPGENAGETAAVQSPPSGQVPAPGGEPLYEGAHDLSDCQNMIGWAWNANDPARRLQVEIYSDGTLLTTATAEDFRQDLRDAGKGDGQYGFTIATPVTLKDGASHSIRMRIAGTSFELWETPRNLNCAP